MARSTSDPGEKPLFWIGSAKSDLLEFPEAVKDEIGVALSVAQFAGQTPLATINTGRQGHETGCPISRVPCEKWALRGGHLRPRGITDHPLPLFSPLASTGVSF